MLPRYQSRVAEHGSLSFVSVAKPLSLCRLFEQYTMNAEPTCRGLPITVLFAEDFETSDAHANPVQETYVELVVIPTFVQCIIALTAICLVL